MQMANAIVRMTTINSTRVQDIMKLKDGICDFCDPLFVLPHLIH